MDVVVCPLSAVDQVIARHRPSHLISLLSAEELFPMPGAIAPERHLKVASNDIVAPADGLVAPAAAHALAVVDFATAWDRRAPIAIHCFAGISRSTAAALIVLCALEPDCDEGTIAAELRAAAPFAAPNRLLVSHGDAVLGRGGRLIAAAEAMGSPVLCAEGRPFALRLRTPPGGAP